MRLLPIFVLLFDNTIAKEWYKCSVNRTCPLKDYEKPPLVILSLDGFSRKYLDLGYSKTLEAIAKCGVTTDRVLPSYPTKTFPNHFTMVTGLYPESHGIVDNNVLDIKISPKLESMQKTTNPKYYTAEPIWSAYQRITGKRAFCLFWPGCGVKGTTHPPHFSPKYNKSMPFDKRVETIMYWLQMKPAERPGLITAYFHEPDSTGHKTDIRTEGLLDETLKEVDDAINYLVARLYGANLTNCVNLVIVGDHGMKRIRRKFYYDDILKNVTGSEKFVLASGAVGRIHLMDSGVNASELADKLQCKNDDCIGNWKTYTKATIPTRKHYANNDRIGDVILEGIHGSTFYKNVGDDKKKFSGDHGFDYMDPEIHTIFFAKGPSFKQNVTVEPFQNVQYMNLWEDLLGINGTTVPNNGSVGFFDDVLVTPRTRVELDKPLTTALYCQSDAIINTISITGNRTDCHFYTRILLLMSENKKNHVCYWHKDCGLVLVRNTTGDVKTIVETGINKISVTNNTSTISLFKESTHKPAYIDLPVSFQKNVLEPLLAKHKEHLQHHLLFHAISGFATDKNYDGLADEIDDVATHFYRIVLYCAGNELVYAPLSSCANLTTTRVVSYIFPIIDIPENVKIVQPDFINDYTATISDVNRIAGFHFNFPSYSFSGHDNVILTQRPFFYR